MSPDGGRIAVAVVADENADIGVMDLERGTRRRPTFAPTTDERSRRSPGGRWISHVSCVLGLDALFRVAAAGGGEPEHLVQGSPAAPLIDGHSALITGQTAGREGRGLVLLDLASGEKSPWLATFFDEDALALSPDGRWLARTSTESGRSEVLVRDVSGGGTPWLVSTSGGSNPTWDPWVGTLHDQSGTVLMRASVASGSSFSAGRPERVFAEGSARLSPDQAGYAIGFGVAPGPRVLVARRSRDDPRAALRFRRGWRPPSRPASERCGATAP